jgi:transposase
VGLGDPAEAGIVKSYEETMRILEAFDLTGSYRAAAALADCDHHTVARCVAARDAGSLAAGPAARDHLIDPFLEKIEEWVERSRGKVRGDIVHERLGALGYRGSERSTRRAVAGAKKRRKLGAGRVYRPWVVEPGMWFQYDFGEGPRVVGRSTQLFCAWLAWSRYRVVLPMWDKALPTVVGCIDSTLRRFGGVPTYALTDNEKTVTIHHVAGIAIRNPDMVAAAHHYGLTVATCVVADPEAKGGSESTVRIAKADVVPTDANLRESYASFGELEAGCEQLCDEVNGRPHGVTRRIPAEMVLEEQRHLHRLPSEPYTLAFGESRTVGRTTPMVDVDWRQYSVPHELRGERVWVREHGDEIVIVHVDKTGLTRRRRYPAGSCWSTRRASTVQPSLAPSNATSPASPSPVAAARRASLSSRSNPVASPPHTGQSCGVPLRAA